MANSYFPVKRFLIVTAVATGLVTSLYAASMTTQLKQQASEAIDLNTAHTITQTNNADGTMGALNAQGNFSATLPASAKGQLKVKVQGKGNENGKGKGKAKGEGNTQTITSLRLQLSKVEVHLANLCGSGNITSYPNPSGKLVPSPSNRKPLDKLTGADKWETLELGEGNSSIDLVALSQGNAAEALGLNSLACGKYSEIRLYVASATASFNNGPAVNVTVPAKGIVRIVRYFEINPSAMTTLTIEVNPQKSLIKNGDTYILKPVVGRVTSDY